LIFSIGHLVFMYLKISAKHIRVFLLFIWLSILFWQVQPLILLK
jgi:hypothetical protein